MFTPPLQADGNLISKIKRFNQAVIKMKSKYK